MRRILLLLPLLLLYVAGLAQTAEKVRLLCNWNDTANIRPQLGSTARYSDVWGFTWKGKEYGVIGSTEGTHVIDVNNCQQVAFYRGRASGPFVVHRDFQTYQHYLYAVCDEGQSSLQIFDLNYLPDSLHLVYESNPMQLSLVHAIFIDTAKAKLYCGSAFGLSTGFDNMRVYSLANPVLPVLTDQINSGSEVHDMYVRNDTAYCSASFYGYMIVKTSTPGSPVLIGGTTSYIQQGYNHSSWINNQGIGVMTDETHGRPMKVIDVNHLPGVQILSTFSPCAGDTCIPHSPYVIGNTVFISHYFDGLQIYSIADPAHPVRLGYYDTYPAPGYNGFGGAWGCYPFLPSRRVLLSDMQTGFYVLDASEALSVPEAQPPSPAITIYPNPATHELFLKLPQSFQGKELSVQVNDVAGRTLLRHSWSPALTRNESVPLPLPQSWAEGLYFLRGKAGDAVFTVRFFKNL